MVSFRFSPCRPGILASKASTTYIREGKRDASRAIVLTTDACMQAFPDAVCLKAAAPPASYCVKFRAACVFQVIVLRFRCNAFSARTTYESIHTSYWSCSDLFKKFVMFSIVFAAGTRPAKATAGSGDALGDMQASSLAFLMKRASDENQRRRRAKVSRSAHCPWILLHAATGSRCTS